MGKKIEKSESSTFEAQLSSLEQIVQSLEDGELTLEQSLTQFEKGVKLTRECQSILDTAEQKVSVLTAGKLEDANLD